MIRGARLLALLACLLMASPASAQTSRADATRAFGDWLVGCDNTRRCTALGQADIGEWMIRVERTADTGAPPRLTLLQPFGEATGPVRIVVDGVPRGATLRLSDADPWGTRRAVVPAADAAGLLAALRPALRIEIVRGDDGVMGEVPARGLTASLLWMEERQRGGPLPAPRVRVAAPFAPGTLSPRPDAVLQLTGRECPTRDGEGDAGGVSRLNPETLLWLPVCEGGAYNFTFLPVLTDSHGRHPRVAELPGPDGRGAGNPVNAAFDTRRNRLAAFLKGRGPGDCGTSAAWAWTGDGFALLEWREMPRCTGIFEADWFVLYRATPVR